MKRKSTPPIPEPIAQLQRQLDQFRSTQSRRTKLPESLWQAAVELARQHGVYGVAHPLRLELPAAVEILLANCLAHGRRQFVDVAANFPDECRYVLEVLGEVYGHDAEALV